MSQRTPNEVYFRTVQENARETREKILKFLMIRRTRTEIDKYYGEDLKRQGLKFPEVANPARPLITSTGSRSTSKPEAPVRSFPVIRVRHPAATSRRAR